MVTIAFVFGIATGIGLSYLYLRLSAPKVSGFTMKEAQAKIGRRVELKENGLEATTKIINTGTVAYMDERYGQRYLVVDWDQLLPGMKHRITWIDRDTYKKAIIEGQP